jgi:polysaccharide biosynthesis transport protein
MELRQILGLIGKWLWLIILSVVIAAGSSYFASRAATPLYRTKTTMMVGQITRNPEASSSDLYTGQQLAYTYSQLARREPVLNGAIESLGLQIGWQALAGQVSTNIVPQTQLLEISVIDSNPYRAKVLADAIAQQLILQSPAGSATTSSEDLNFIRDQISELKSKIESGQEEIKRLSQELDTSNSALQIQDLTNQINLLETKVSGWQDTYSQLLLSLQGGDVNVLNVVEEATIPSPPISPNTPMNVLVAAAIGLALAVGGVLLMEYLDDTIKTPDDIERATGLATIGTIVDIDGKTDSDKLIAKGDPFNPVLEGFRSLRNNILYSTSKKSFRVILLTSTTPGEGKSICIANLAVVMANMGQRVILVDSDFRRATLNKIFNLPNDIGLSTALQKEGTNIRQYLLDVGVKNLKVITSGPLPENPNFLLESGRMEEILQDFRNQADVVLFDSPPILMVSDAATLATLVDGVILVVETGSNRGEEVRHVVNEMRRIHIPFIGAVLNRIPRKKRGYYYNYYGYYYRYAEDRQPSHRSRNWIAGIFGRKGRSLPPIELPEQEMPPQPAIVDSAPDSSKSNGSAKVSGKAGDSKKKVKVEPQRIQEELIISDSAAETEDEVLLEIRKSLIKKP